MSAQPHITTVETSDAPLRPISFGDPQVTIERKGDGTIYLRPNKALGEYPVRLTDRLHHWASATPDRVFMAEREAGGGWRQLTYAQLLTSSRHIASALLRRGLSAERPVVILSGNSIDHALIAFGALYAGIPFCPVSPAYSLMSKDYGKLAFLMKLLTPGLIFVDDAGKFADALNASVPCDIEIVAVQGALPGRDLTRLANLLAAPEHPRLDAAHDAIGPDTIAKFLLTSGSTGNSKAVINTQAMICANQVMIRETMAFLKDEPPVIVDWLPWNHTFGGNHNIGLTLYNGGSMYLDAGKPMPGGIEETVRNLREISPTVYFNVPKGYESLLPYLRDDANLRKKFFARLHAMFFAGAALSPYVWNSLDEFAVQETGSRVPVLTGLGATETAPFHQPLRPCRAAGGGQRRQAGAEQWQAGSSCQGAECHAGLLAPAGIDRQGFRRGRFLQIRRCAEAGRSERFQRRLRFRRAHRRRFQAGERHLGQRRPVTRALRRGLRAPGARCRHCRDQSRRDSSIGGPRSRRLPPDQSDACLG
jgi:feruloyl-CoA synthase